MQKGDRFLPENYCMLLVPLFHGHIKLRSIYSSLSFERTSCKRVTALVLSFALGLAKKG